MSPSKPKKLQISKEFEEKLKLLYSKNTSSSKISCIGSHIAAKDKSGGKATNSTLPPPPPLPPPLPPHTIHNVNVKEGVYVVEKTIFEQMLKDHTFAAVKELLPEYVDKYIKQDSEQVRLHDNDIDSMDMSDPDAFESDLVKKNTHERSMQRIGISKKRRKIQVERNGTTKKVIHPRHTDTITDTCFMNIGE
jgi:hypothetical protein